MEYRSRFRKTGNRSILFSGDLDKRIMTCFLTRMSMLILMHTSLQKVLELMKLWKTGWPCSGRWWARTWGGICSGDASWQPRRDTSASSLLSRDQRYFRLRGGNWNGPELTLIFWLPKASNCDSLWYFLLCSASFILPALNFTQIPGDEWLSVLDCIQSPSSLVKLLPVLL